MEQPITAAHDASDHSSEKENEKQVVTETGFDGAVNPRKGSHTGPIKPQSRKLHDPAVTFEEYYYYAQITREEEEENAKNMGATERGLLSLVFPSKSDSGVALKHVDPKHSVTGEDLGGDKLNLGKQEVRANISDEEWTNASRALRTATWGAAFYLITTDILGPFNLPYAFASLGWGPGIVLYSIFAVLAGYSGYLLWQMFLDLDSYEFPLRSYGDLAYRLFGQPLRWLMNLIQGFQLIFNVGLLVITNGEALSQVAKFNLCFAVCCLIWVLVGFGLGQIRTLQKFGWLANAAVWINLLCMFVSMGGAANNPPNYKAATSSAGASINGGADITPNAQNVYPPVMTSAGIPDTGGIVGSTNGAMNAVFAYGGAMVFPEFMAEMKHPRDFLKGMWSAQLFIYICYMLYGLFFYGYQGQYVVAPSYLGISSYGFQTAGNIFAMLSAVIAAALYGNIGIKVIYNNIFVEFFHAPLLTTKSGKIIWVALIPLYWAAAYLIAAGLPNVEALQGIVAALCILHFTYSFPPLLSVMHMCMKNGMREGDGFDANTGETKRSGSLMQHISRGFFAGRWYQNVFNVLYCLGALALAGLGAYGSIEVLIAGFANGTTSSYTCHSPLDG